LTTMINFFVFHKFCEEKVFASITHLIDKIERNVALNEDDKKAYLNAVIAMSESAEWYGIDGNPWHIWLAGLFVRVETVFSLVHERRNIIEGSYKQLAMAELETFAKLAAYDLRDIDKAFGVHCFERVAKFTASAKDKIEGASRIQLIAKLIGQAEDGSQLYEILKQIYSVQGVGDYAVSKAFRLNGEEKQIVPITNTEDISLSNIIGYEEQKRILCENTEAFLEGRPANNVLLYGESGTGKSTSIKALLNDYAANGLRMVEVYKHQIEDLDKIVNVIKDRNYKFIIFMDDLSFEQFEIEYKYLKSFIEGGLEKRPDNVLIYATSNRRHLMKESWKDKDDIQDDMHESETMQEKMSLVDRFGLLIRYLSPEQKEYLRIARELAAEYGVETGSDFNNGAIRWELQHGGFSGRSARQYVEHLAGRKA